MPSYKPTPKQLEAFRLLGSDAKHILLYGGSRSAKTFTLIRALLIRAVAAENSRHAILRFRFNHLKASVIYDTWPKVLDLCFPGLKVEFDKTDWYARLPNGSQVWFGGLDDKERVEKVLGQEHATILLNEVSQIPFSSRNVAVTRLAQLATHNVGGENVPLRLKMYYDCNPPSKAHWSYQLFFEGRDPDSKQPIHRGDYGALQMNPMDNRDNLPADYLQTLAGLPARMRKRFLEGEFVDANEGALWTLETIEKYRSIGDLPDMQRIVIGVDPSGSGDTDNTANDEIGIVVCGLGTDGNGYVLEDLTLKAGPQKWGNVVGTAYDRHGADVVVAEKNFGGDMVRFVIQAARPKTPCEMVTASRGKVVRAEPISALHEQGKIRLAGNFEQLEDELCSFTTNGYMGTNSPNRADAMIWAMTKLFPGMVKEHQKKADRVREHAARGPQGFLAA